MFGGWLPSPLARRPLAVVLAIAATLLVWRLGAYGLWESTEARYAEIAAAMVRSGDWLVPRLNGIVHLDKPPLAYWTTAAGLVALGIDALGARVGQVAASLATIAVVHRWAEDRGGPLAGVAASLSLLSMPLFFALSRSVSTDAWLALWVVLAIDSARRGSRPGAPRGWRLLAWAAIGTGFLTKGPVILLWTAAPAIAWAAATRGWRRLARLLDPWGVVLAVAIALPWYIAVAASRPEAIDYWLGGQTAGRMTAAYEGESDAWWAYLPVALWGAGPWIFPAAAGLIGGSGRRSIVPDRALLAAWIVVPLVLFSIFPTKRANYLLPMLPAVALAAGVWWARVDRPRGVLRVVSVLLAATGIGFLVASFLPVSRELPRPLSAIGVFAGPAFLLGAVATWLAAGRRDRGAALAGAALPFLGLYLALYSALSRPRVEAWAKISRPLAVVADETRGAGDGPVVAWRDWPRAFPFYLGERIVTVGTGERARIFEPDSTWREWILPDEAITGLWHSGRRRLFFVPRDRLDVLEEKIGERAPVVAATRRWILTTNRPEPGETAPVGADGSAPAGAAPTAPAPSAGARSVPPSP